MDTKQDKQDANQVQPDATQNTKQVAPSVTHAAVRRNQQAVLTIESESSDSDDCSASSPQKPLKARRKRSRSPSKKSRSSSRRGISREKYVKVKDFEKLIGRVQHFVNSYFEQDKRVVSSEESEDQEVHKQMRSRKSNFDNLDKKKKRKH